MEIDVRYVGFENDHAYLKTSGYGHEGVESSETLLPKSHAVAVSNTPFTTKYKNETVSKVSSPSNVPSNSKKIFVLANASNRSLPTNITLSPNNYSGNQKLSSTKKSTLVPILPKITNTEEMVSIFPTQSTVLLVPSTSTPLRRNSQSMVQKNPQIINKFPREHTIEIDEQTKNNFTKDIGSKVCNIKLSPYLLQRIQSGEKLFMCMECDKVYTEHKDLVDHQKIHKKIDKNFVYRETEKKETVFINNKQSIKIDENVQIINGAKNVANISNPIFQFSYKSPANLKKRKDVFQGECIMCHSVFQDLGNHLRTVHKSDLYQKKISSLTYHCHECDLEFDIKSQLLAHELAAHKNTYTHTCEHCFKRFSFREDLETHLKTRCIDSLKYLCPYCDTGYSNADGLKTHLTKHIGFNIVENTTQDLTANQGEYGLTRRPEHIDQLFSEFNHISDNNNELYVQQVVNNVYRVGYLNDDNSNTDVLSSSLNSVIDNNSTTDVDFKKDKFVDGNNVTCNQEQKSFHKNRVSYTVCRICLVIVSYSRIGNHMKKKHNDAAPYKCEICYAEFNRKHVMDDHRRKHTNNKPHKCNECSKCFTYKHHLNRHKVLLHKADSLEKPFKCSACDKAFSFKEYLALHINSRHKGKHYMCQICGKSFSTNAVLTKHQLCHTDDRPFMCEHCGRTFKCKTHCETHTKNMHPGGAKLALPPEKFECDFCHKNFTTKIYRDMHYKRHIGLGHQCDICFKLFVSKAHLHRHVKIMHQN